MDTAEILTALGTPAGRADPYPLYAALHEVGEVIELGPGSVLVIGYDAINSVLRDPGFRVSDESSLDTDFPGWRANPVFVQVMDSSPDSAGPALMRTMLVQAGCPGRLRLARANCGRC